MPELSLPTASVRASFLAAMQEFRAEGRGRLADDTMVGREIQDWVGRWDTAEGFASYVAALRRDAKMPRVAGFVPCTTWWWVEGPDYLGRIALRHRLTGWLPAFG